MARKLNAQEIGVRTRQTPETREIALYAAYAGAGDRGASALRRAQRYRADLMVDAYVRAYRQASLMRDLRESPVASVHRRASPAEQRA